MEEKHYTNDEVTIVWKAKLCTHSTHCWRGLPEVFKPKEKPWITPETATSQEIIEQVGNCPSGALTAFLNSNSNE